MNNSKVFALRRARGWEFVQRHVNALARDNPKWKKIREGVVSKLGQGFIFALIGPQGRGKTQLAVDVMLQASDSLISSEYTTASGFFLELKACFESHEHKTEKAVLESFCKPKLLVIDEFEKRSESTWFNNLIFELLNRRYGMLLDTLIMTNCDKPAFDQLVGASLSSRINETGGIITCNWETFRK